MVLLSFLVVPGFFCWEALALVGSEVFCFCGLGWYSVVYSGCFVLFILSLLGCLWVFCVSSCRFRLGWFVWLLFSFARGVLFGHSAYVFLLGSPLVFLRSRPLLLLCSVTDGLPGCALSLRFFAWMRAVVIFF